MATPRSSSFAIEGADGRPIRGNVHTSARSGEARPTVVICHGFKGFKDWGMFPVIAGRLAQAGFTAIRFNFSGSGVSDGDQFDQPDRFRADTLSRQVDDLGRILDWTGKEAVGVLGHSRGGGVATLRAARDRRVAVLVTWAGIARAQWWDDETVSRWRAEGKVDIVNARTGEVLEIGLGLLDDLDAHRDELDIERAAANVSVPWLIVHGSDDEAVSLDEAERLANARSGGLRELHVVEGGSHTFGARHLWAGPTPALEEALDQTVAWLSRHLGG